MVEKPGDNSLARLKNLYTHAKELSEKEVRCDYIASTFTISTFAVFSSYYSYLVTGQLYVPLILDMETNSLISKMSHSFYLEESSNRTVPPILSPI